MLKPYGYSNILRKNVHELNISWRNEKTNFKTMKTIEIDIIREDTDYKNALKRIQQIFDAKPGSKEYYELKLLSMEVESFENENINFPNVDPIDIISFIIDQRELSQNDLVSVLGDKTTVSKVLNRKRPLTLQMIRKFCEFYHIPAGVMIKDYQLATRISE